ncbi:MAG TPA: hypothetical protein VLB79_02935 [Solirubrobacterales bacterium]|nr:hypothetical protein [Solirubrobacterales bacterium]
MEAINLEWTPLRGASAYRLTVTDSSTGERLLRTDPLDQPRYALDTSLADGREIEARLEFLPERAEEGAWEEAGPTVRVPVPDPRADVTILRWEGVSSVHRLVIADQTAARTVLDRPVLGSSYPYVPSPSERGHDLVMRVHSWRDGDWDEGTEWRPLPLRVLVGERRDPPPPLESDGAAPLLLAFTIDTEGFLARQSDPNPATAVDELIFGDYGNFEHYGVGLHMDLLEHFGFRGCFFVDVLSQFQYGREALQRTVDAIAERGHEVELHVHDEHLRNSDDPAVRALAGDMANMDGDRFRRLMGLAVQVFERLTGKQPGAYRAGGYRITDEHFPVLEEFGIKIDSSVQAYFHAHVSEWMRTRTQPYWIGDVLEVPPTWTLVRDQRDAPETRALAPNATAGDPVSRMPVSPTGVPRIATYVSHSCELMRVDRDVTQEAIAEYERSLRARVRKEVADRVMLEVAASPRLIDGRLDEDLVFRVAGILRRIADRDDARCVTFAELREIAGSFPREVRREPVDPVPVIDRPHGAATVTGTRVYSRELLEHLTSTGTPGRARTQSGGDDVSALVNADVSWEGKDVAVVGEGAPAVTPWLERRGVKSAERLEGPRADATGRFDVVVWLSGFERCAPSKLRGRLDAAAGMLREDGALVLRVRTLGAAPEPGNNGEPPLAELLFPASTLRADEVTAWDASTFSSWLAAQGFEIIGRRPVSRSGIEIAALERFPDKLAAIPDEELRTAGADFTLRRAADGGAGQLGADSAATGPQSAASEETAQGKSGAPAPADLVNRFGAVAPGDDVLVITAGGSAAPRIDIEDVQVTGTGPEELVGAAPAAASCDVVICSGAIERIDLERLQEACGALYRSLRPGGQLLLGVSASGLATPATIVVALLRAGFEVVASEDSAGRNDFRLLRPLELADIASFSGLTA